MRGCKQPKAIEIARKVFEHVTAKLMQGGLVS